MIDSRIDRETLAIDALTGLSVGDAVGNQAFRNDVRVHAPGLSAEVWS